MKRRRRIRRRRPLNEVPDVRHDHHHHRKPNCCALCSCTINRQRVKPRPLSVLLRQPTVTQASATNSLNEKESYSLLFSLLNAGSFSPILCRSLSNVRFWGQPLCTTTDTDTTQDAKRTQTVRPTHSLTVLDANGQKAMAATAAAESGHLLSLTLTPSLSLSYSLSPLHQKVTSSSQLNKCTSTINADESISILVPVLPFSQQ